MDKKWKRRVGRLDIQTPPPKLKKTRYIDDNGIIRETIHDGSFSPTPKPDPDQRYFPNAVPDYDGNWYDAVIIGDQVWVAENLRTTHYADGTAAAYRSYEASEIPLDKRGYLYGWDAMMNGASSSDLNPSGVQGIAPNGWHIPSKSELETLVAYLNSQSAYKYNNKNDFIAKSIASNSYWESYTQAGCVGNNMQENNLTGLSLQPAGHRRGTTNYEQTGIAAILWSSTESGGNGYYFAIYYSYYGAVFNIQDKHINKSVRCVCDLSPEDFRWWYVNTYHTKEHIV